MREIGGFFELELKCGIEYHDNSIKLNYGRNALEYVLRANNYKKVYLPYYICRSMIEPMEKIGINYEYYEIDENLNIILNFNKLKENDLLIYVNYFGICDNIVKELIEIKKKFIFNLCIDNSQAFFSLPMGEDHTIYSARKFFGVSDGAYLYTNTKLESEMEREYGYDKSEHLIKRIDIGCNEAYIDFKKAMELHTYQDIRKMSLLSQKILASIDYKSVKKKRKENFNLIHSYLKRYNKLELDIDDEQIPMIYPFVSDKFQGIREYLIDNKIYVAKYWPELSNFKITNDLIAIPIDQRYDKRDMMYIIELINKYIVLKGEE